mmetsp:Transcript_13775/g.40277  ORF Transcript_13775/g.40277 Transcript_13775/m.40277 type:complete len:253 (+) Transcript_13775:468-1226(+)
MTPPTSMDTSSMKHTSFKKMRTHGRSVGGFSSLATFLVSRTNARFSNVVMVSPPPSFFKYPYPRGFSRIELRTKPHPRNVMVSENAFPILIGRVSLFITSLDDSSSRREISARVSFSDFLFLSFVPASSVSPSSPLPFRPNARTETEIRGDDRPSRGSGAASDGDSTRRADDGRSAGANAAWQPTDSRETTATRHAAMMPHERITRLIERSIFLCPGVPFRSVRMSFRFRPCHTAGRYLDSLIVLQSAPRAS